MTLKVRRKRCDTCIYGPRSASRASIEELEAEAADLRMQGHFKSFRACHHFEKGDVVCNGFWERHHDHFDAGQIAQRLNAVEYVDEPPKRGREFFLSLKADQTQCGTPCEKCQWPNGPDITHTVRLAARMGAWFACKKDGKTCFGALAYTKSYYHQRELEMSSKSKRKNEKRKEYRANPYADAHRAVRGEAPPGYPSMDEMAARIAAAREGYGPEQVEAAIKRRRELSSAIDKANAGMEPKNGISTRQPGATDYSNWSDHDIAALTNSRARGKMREASRRVATAVEEQQPRIEIPEVELIAAMDAARSTGRSTMTPEELSRLLLMPHATPTSDQRGFIRGKR